ncbi:hypothetical protein EMCRGX_G006497 [Ephydatia muelleri]
MLNYSIAQISNFSNGCFNGATTSHPGLDFLSTYIIQSVRCVVLVCLLLASLVLYSSVKVMGKSMFNIGTCSVLWALCFGTAAFKAVEIIVLLSVLKYMHVIRAGFVIITVTQCFTVMVLMMALDHEWMHRSSAVDARHQVVAGLCCCFGQWKWNIFRKAVYAAIAVAAPCALMVAMEITSISEAMFVSFLALLLLPRLLVGVMSVRVVLGLEDLKPTISAKVFLLSGVLCSLAEDIPYFLLTTSELCLKYASVYDLLQLLGIASMVLLFLFLRNQFQRVEEECKLAMVWSVQSQMAISRTRIDTTTYQTF